MSKDVVFLIALFTAVYLALIILAHRRTTAHDDKLTEYFVSGRDLGTLSAIATLGATEIGLITIAYNAQKGFNAGFSAFHIGIAALIGCLFVGLIGFVVAPLRKTGVLTIPEYYEQRYGRDVRVFGAIVMALGGILNMGLFLKVASLFIVAMLTPLGAQIPVNAVMITLIVVAVVYTCYGGMRSVVLTDIFQFILLAIGLIIACIYLSNAVGFDAAVEAVNAKKGAGGFDPLKSEGFGPTYVLWMIFVAGVVSSAIWPTALTRALLIKNEHDVKKVYLYSSVIFMGRMVLPALIGVLAFAYFAGPGAVEEAKFLSEFGDDADLVATPIFLGLALPSWLFAFMVVAMFASFMSTQDSYLFCWSSVLSRDVYGALTGTSNDADRQIFVTRIGIALIALYELYWGLVYEGKEDIWDYLAVSGSIYFCSGVVLLAGGLYWKRATRRGAWAALILGFTAIIALEPIRNALGLSDVSAPVIGFTTIALSLIGFVVGSLTEKPKTNEAAVTQTFPTTRP